MGVAVELVRKGEGIVVVNLGKVGAGLGEWGRGWGMVVVDLGKVGAGLGEWGRGTVVVDGGSTVVVGGGSTGEVVVEVGDGGSNDGLGRGRGGMREKGGEERKIKIYL